MIRIHDSTKFPVHKQIFDMDEQSNTHFSLETEDLNRTKPHEFRNSTLPVSVRTWKGKNSLNDNEEIMFDMITLKESDDSLDEIGSTSFSGASHPPEPVDIDLMMSPVCVPIDQKKVTPSEEKCVLKSSMESSPLHRDSEKECIWDVSLPPSGNVSPISMSIDNSCCTSVHPSDGMVSMKGSIRGDSMESGKTSISRASDSSGLSDDSNWSNFTGSANKPHKGNDPRWNAIIAIRGRDGLLGMNQFRLLRRLGCGDIGSVYLSELSGTHCYFAMKVMDKASLASRKKLARAQTEREILQLLDHPFLPTLYTHFETDRFTCLVMEYCPGGDLHTLRQRQPGRHFSELAARYDIYKFKPDN